MHPRNLAIGFVLLSVLVLTPTVLADASEAARQCDLGKQLLSKGDFDAALAAFKAAAKADPENQEYFQRCAVLQRVMNLREQLASEQDAAMWEKMAGALCNFYRQNKVYAEALELATALHDKSKSAESAATLADIQLAMGKNREAADLLAGLGDDKATPHTQILHGIALSRLGQTDEAKAQASAFKLPENCTGQLCLDAARLYALTGDADQACSALVCYFEMTPGNWLADARTEAKECADFRGLAETPGFAKALQTESKVKGCGGCSKSCSKNAAGCGDKAKDAGCKGHDKEQ